MDKYYLVFTSDNGNNEDCSVYYSSLVFAKDEDEAIDKLIATSKHSLPKNRYEALEMDLIK